MSTTPRLSLALRSISNSTSTAYESVNESDAELFAKKQILLRQSSGNASKQSLALRQRLSWHQICQIVKQMSSDLNSSEQLLGNIVKECKTLLPDEVETVAAFCLYLFADSRGICSLKDAADFKQTFGVTEASSNRLSTIAKNVDTILNETCADVELLKEKLLLNESSQSKQHQQEFGAKIPVNVHYGTKLGDDFDPSEFEIINRLLAEVLKENNDEESGDEESTMFHHDSLKYPMGDVGQEEESNVPQAGSEYGPHWLKEQIGLVIPDTELSQQIAQNVLDLLVSNRSNDELQSQLLDLIGFDGFELISSIISNRSRIVDKANKKSAKTLENLGVNLKISAKVKRGAGGISVLTQDDLEYERAVKKANAQQARSGAFQTPYQKLQQVSNVAKKQNQPEGGGLLQSLIGANITGNVLAKYPYVFDSMAEVQRSASFIANVKLYLPVGCQRKEHKTYEEVTIPPVKRSNDNPYIKKVDDVGEPPVLIKSLDTWCQKAFDGTKKLNKIQSVVFDSAYNTNQNLLICAPTGAGKTNIAMLTILHELDQNRDELTGKIRVGF